MLDNNSKKEMHPRLAKEDIDLLGYDKLIMKILVNMANARGQWVYDHKESLQHEAMIGILKAYDVYDPTRGTFVTIAYLKIHTEMTRFLNKKSRAFVCMNYLEDLKFGFVQGGTAKMTWQDLFPSNNIDYIEVARLSIKEDDEIGWEIFRCLCDGVPWSSVHKRVGLTREETKERKELLKEDMIAVVKELVGGPEFY